MRPTSAVCDRARTYASLQLDAELAQLEASMLRAHLGRCEACRAYHADIGNITRELRSAPLQRLEHRVVLPHRRRVSLGGIQAAAAAAVALVAVGAASLVADFSGDRSTTRGFASAKRPAYFQSVEYEMRLLERYDGVALTDGTELIF